MICNPVISGGKASAETVTGYLLDGMIAFAYSNGTDIVTELGSKLKEKTVQKNSIIVIAGPFPKELVRFVCTGGRVLARVRKTFSGGDIIENGGINFANRTEFVVVVVTEDKFRIGYEPDVSGPQAP